MSAARLNSLVQHLQVRLEKIHKVKHMNVKVLHSTKLQGWWQILNKPKNILGTNGLAYFRPALGTDKKRFMCLIEGEKKI